MATNNSLQFYRARAEEARKQAEAATLSHVRERCRRSEAAWTQLADRAALAEKNRQQQAMLKAAAVVDEP